MDVVGAIGFLVGVLLVLGTIYVVLKWVYKLIKRVVVR